jgi:hypothetical protein
MSTIKQNPIDTILQHFLSIAKGETKDQKQNFLIQFSQIPLLINNTNIPQIEVSDLSGINDESVIEFANSIGMDRNLSVTEIRRELPQITISCNDSTIRLARHLIGECNIPQIILINTSYAWVDLVLIEHGIITHAQRYEKVSWGIKIARGYRLSNDVVYFDRLGLNFYQQQVYHQCPKTCLQFLGTDGEEFQIVLSSDDPKYKTKESPFLQTENYGEFISEIEALITKRNKIVQIAVGCITQQKIPLGDILMLYL